MTSQTVESAFTVHGLFQEQVLRTPERPALIVDGDSFTYEELRHRARGVARLLIDAGVERGDLVGICMGRSVDLVAALLGILETGAAYVPLDPDYPKARIELIIDDAAPRTILVDPQGSSRIPSSQMAGSVTLSGNIPEEGPDKPVDIESHELAYVIYTSGSTGKPKGVMVEHGNVVNFISGMDDRLRSENGGVWLAVTSVSFDISVLELFGTLSRGFTVVLHRDRAGASAGPLMAEHKATHLQCTPSMARMLLADRKARQGLGLLEQLLVGGEALPADLGQELTKVVPGEVINMYGPTETTVWSTQWVVDPDVEEVSLGHPILNTDLYLLDQFDQQVPIGEVGELVIGGAGVARGYLNRPELTDERFVPHPFRDGAPRVYRTGDLVRVRPDGTLEYLGRSDHQVKIRGHRVELGEIELTITQHDDVEQAVVVGRNDGSGSQQLVAYVVPEEGKKLESDQLRAHVASFLPDIMVPAAFITLDELPLTPNGKVDRKSLPEQQLEKSIARTEDEPRDDLELRLTATFQRVLSVANIGLRDDFFERGGHSLLAVQMLVDIERSFGVELTFPELLRAPTVEGIASLVRSREAPPSLTDALVLNKGSDGTPIFFICGIHIYRELAAQLDPSHPAYALFVQAEYDLLREDRRIDAVRFPSVETLAADYLDQIVRARPQGPYILAGLSFGGLLAVEIALQLKARRGDDEVSLVALLDSLPPSLENPGLRRKFVYHARRFLRRGPAHLLERLRIGYFSRKPRHAPALKSERYDERSSSMAVLRRRIYTEAGAQYQLSSYDGNLGLFIAERDHSLANSSLVESEWRRLARGRFDVYRVPGGHVDMLRPPHVHTLGSQLQLVINRISQS